MQKLDHYIGFKEKRHFFHRKSLKFVISTQLCFNSLKKPTTLYPGGIRTHDQYSAREDDTTT
jgi:hypothetical protein